MVRKWNILPLLLVRCPEQFRHWSHCGGEVASVIIRKGNSHTGVKADAIFFFQDVIVQHHRAGDTANGGVAPVRSGTAFRVAVFNADEARCLDIINEAVGVLDIFSERVVGNGLVAAASCALLI